jgi:Flp pilus assembly protein TadG
VTANRTTRRERGSATTELVLLTPLLILFVLLIVCLGRFAHARALIDDAAAQAARAATLNYLSPNQATTAARQTAATALADAGVNCLSQLVRVDTGNDHPGGTVTVTLYCRVELSQQIGAGLPGSRSLTATFTSPVDTYVPSTQNAAS